MRKFDGIYKDQYETIFGIFKLNCLYDDDIGCYYEIEQLTDTCVSYSGCDLKLRWFSNKTQALYYLIKLERKALDFINNYIRGGSL